MRGMPLHYTRNAVTLHTRNAVTLHTKNAVTLHTRNVVTLHTRNAVTLHTRNAVTLHTRNAVTLHTRNAVTLHRRNAVTLHTRNAVTYEECRRLGRVMLCYGAPSTARQLCRRQRVCANSLGEEPTSTTTYVSHQLRLAERKTGGRQ
jgi:hypothetical protein